MDSLELNKDNEKTSKEVAKEETNVTAGVQNTELEKEKTTEEMPVSEEKTDVAETAPVEEKKVDTDVEVTKAVPVEEKVEENLPVSEEAALPVAETSVVSSSVETEAVVVVNPDSNSKHKDKTEKKDYSSLSKEELVEALKVLSLKEITEIKEDVESIKQNFYKKTKAFNEDLKAKFVEAGGKIEEFIPAKDELEDSFRTLLGNIRTKRAEYTAKIEREKEQNLLEKQHILQQMKVLIEKNDDVSGSINEFKELQQKWKTIGQVPQTKVNELWREYSNCQESFWDLVKINNELREYDFRKNLETKTILCEAAERLADEPDVVSAFRQLQQLHEEWRETGPVARDLREEIWTRFKNASTVVNKRHQDYFDELRKKEDENAKIKEELCTKIEGLDYSNLKTFKEWDEASKNILKWQEEWRKVGFAPLKVNQKLYERYRKACDAFFVAKTTFYKELKNDLAQNLEKKTALCEQAEALKDSTDWKETGDKLIQIQKEWRTIGPVHKKYADDLWKRFITACDYFFEQKSTNTSDKRTEELENLNKKKELIKRIKALNIEEQEKSLKQLREMIVEWNAIGYVPFKEKDKIYKEYRTAVDKQFDALNVDTSNRRMNTFRSNLEDMASKGENKLYREREKMTRAYEHLKSEIATYENNLGFFTSSSKKGGGLIQQMERKIEGLKEECRLLEEKIKLLEDKLSES